MSQHRTTEQVKKFDIFKIIILVILLLLLFPCWFLRPRHQGPPPVSQATPEAMAATSQPAPTATAAEKAAATTPTAPTLAQPGEVTAGKVTLTGTGEPGSEVEIVVDGKVVGKAKVGSDGKWSFNTNLPKAGEYQISVQSVDADGKKLAESEAVALKVAKAVVAPTLDKPGEVTAGKVTLTGTGEPGSEVEIVVDGKVVGKAKVGSDGKWSFDANLPKAGEYQISVQSVDADGKVLAESEAVALKVTKAVVAPTLDKLGEATAGKVTLTGTGEPGSEVEIVVDGKVVGKAKVGANGKWSFNTNLPKAGEYQISVQSVDADGKVLAASKAVTLKVAKAVVAPTLDKLGEVTAGKVTLTGTGEPGSEVEIVVDGKVVGKAKVGSDGKWSFNTNLPKAGEYQISVQSVDAAGKVLAESEAVALKVTKAVVAPTLAQPGEATAGKVTLTGTGEPGSEVEIVVDSKVVGKAKVGSDGKWSFNTNLPKAGEYQISVQSVDADGKKLAESEAVTLKVAKAVVAPTLDKLGEVTAGKVTLTGTGEPGSEVEIVVDGKVVGKAKVGANGKWSFNTNLPKAGEYQISVQSVDAAGKVLAASKAVTLKVVKVVVAPTLDKLGEVTAGKVTLTGTGEPGSEVEIVVDSKVVGKAKVGSDGKWSFNTNLPKAGEYQISVQSVDADGKVLAASKAVTLKVAKAVVAPTLDKLGEVTAGKVTLTGTGEPGSEVEIVVDGKVVGKAKVGANGKWSFNTNLPKAGEYQISVQSVDAAGKVLAASKAVTLKVVKVVVAPTLDKLGEVTAGKVTLTGTGEPGSEVEIVVDGKVVGKAKVGSDGKWNFAADLSKAGKYKISVQSVGEAGSAGASSAERSVAVAAAEPEGQAYIVQADDWLSKLALKFYSDMTKYPVIVEATNAKAKADSTFTVITNPDLIEIGQKLWIPAKAP